MKYVVDTNVVTELLKARPDSRVIDWFQDHDGLVYLASITIKELYFGMLRLPEGKRKSALREAITSIVMECADSILSFDGYSGYLCAEFHQRAVLSGRTPTIEDLMIAAICQRNDAVLVTRNVRDFDYLGVSTVNPFEYERPALTRSREGVGI